LYEYAGIVSPHPKVSAGVSGMGVNVTSPEPDAVVRKMPVLIRINGKIYPSMILENVRLLNGSKRIKVIAKEHGIDEVLVSKKAGIPVNHNAEMYINYAHPEKYVQLSATEVLTENFNENKINADAKKHILKIISAKVRYGNTGTSNLGYEGDKVRIYQNEEEWYNMNKNKENTVEG